MKDYTGQELSYNLKKIGIKKGDVVLVHSAIQNLGIIKGAKIDEIPNIIIKTLFDAVGEEGTILMPVYRYDFPKKKTCDLNDAKSEVGVLTEIFRTMKGVVRSGHPMFSICGKGPLANKILKPTEPEYNPFGEDSVFDRLHELDAYMLFIGIDIRVCTYMVYCEAKNSVKYRFYKPFHGKITLLNGKTIEGDFFHFCFPINNEIREDYTTVQKRLLDGRTIKTFKIGMSKAYLFKSKEFCDKISLYLKEDPWILLRSKPKRLFGFIEGEEKVIEYID